MPFQLGINFPWVACGHDFGPHPRPWAGAPATPWDEVRRELEALREIGITVVRWWVLAGGVNYPCGDDIATYASRTPWLEPYARWRRPLLRRTPDRFEPRAPPPRLPEAFMEDFERLLAACVAADVRLWPSLMSFEWFLPIEDQPKGVASGGRGEFALRSNRETFLERTLEPLLDLSDRYRGAIEAWEIVNEPGWALRRGAVERFGNHPPFQEDDDLVPLLLDGVRRVANHGHRASVGFVAASPSFVTPNAMSALRELAGRSRYVHQLHHYPREDRSDRLPPASRSPIRPCWVGEIATSRHVRWTDEGLREDDPSRFLERRIELVQEAGYEGAMLWAARAEDPHALWNEETKRQVRRAAARIGV